LLKKAWGTTPATSLAASVLPVFGPPPPTKFTPMLLALAAPDSPNDATAAPKTAETAEVRRMFLSPKVPVRGERWQRLPQFSPLK
jgi:hypothetical protein